MQVFIRLLLGFLVKTELYKIYYCFLNGKPSESHSFSLQTKVMILGKPSFPRNTRVHKLADNLPRGFTHSVDKV